MYRLFAYKFLADFWVIMPILVPFYKSNGMSAAQILTTQAAFSLSQMLFEIPSGYLSDCAGRRRTLIGAAALMLAGVCLYSFSKGFWWFILAELVLGIACALRSGTDSALLYDSLKETGHEGRYTRFEGRAEFWCRTGTAVSSIAGGVLGAYVTLRLPFYVNMATALLMTVVALTLREPVREKQPHGNPFANILRITRRSVSTPPLFLVMILSGIIMSTGVTAIWGYFLFYGKAGLPLYWYGVIFAVMQMSSAFGARHSHDFVRSAGAKTSYLLLAVSGPIFLAFGLTDSLLLIPLVLVHAVIWGISTPFLLERINVLTSSDIRATTLSISSMVGRVFYIIGGPVFGWVADHDSIGTAFLAMGVMYMVVVPVLSVLWNMFN
jgi:MFS family permease